MSLLTIRTEVKARGFSRFTDTQLNQYINWSRNKISRKGLWNWERKTQVINIVAGSAPTFDLSTIADFGSVAKVTITTANYRRTLSPMLRSDFEKEWFPLDLTLSQYRGEPTSYAVWGNTLHILPPPKATRAGTIFYHAKLAYMAADGDPSGMPTEADEWIVVGTLIHCHERAQEWEAANHFRAVMEEFYDDMRIEEGMRSGEEPDRVQADDTWL